MLASSAVSIILKVTRFSSTLAKALKYDHKTFHLEFHIVPIFSYLFENLIYPHKLTTLMQDTKIGKVFKATINQ